MSSITEVKPDRPAWPCCPLMSGSPVPIKPPNGAILSPNQVAIGPMLVPCVEDDCPMFDSEKKICSLRVGGEIHHSVQNVVGVLSEIGGQLHRLVDTFADIKLVLEPPKGSPSPLMRVANSLAEIVENIKKKG